MEKFEVMKERGKEESFEKIKKELRESEDPHFEKINIEELSDIDLEMYVKVKEGIERGFLGDELKKEFLAYQEKNNESGSESQCEFTAFLANKLTPIWFKKKEVS